MSKIFQDVKASNNFFHKPPRDKNFELNENQYDTIIEWILCMRKPSIKWISLVCLTHL